VQPQAAKIDEEHRYPVELVRRMAELGLMGVAVPESYGGAGMDNLAYVLAMEEISSACASTGVIMSVNNSLVCDPIMRHGTEEQKREFLVPWPAARGLAASRSASPKPGATPPRRRR